MIELGVVLKNKVTVKLPKIFKKETMSETRT